MPDPYWCRTMSTIELERYLPDDIIIQIAKYWLTSNKYASLTLRKATSRLLAEKYDYKVLEKLYIQRLDISLYAPALENISKPIISETPTSISCYVQLCGKTSMYPIYVLKYETTQHANIWISHWLRRSNGIRRFGRHSPTTTFFLTNDNVWVE